MNYRITNKSHQEGMVLLNGQWTVIAPGQVLSTSTLPGERTANIRIQRIMDVLDEAEGVPLPQTRLKSKTLAEHSAPPPKVAADESEAAANTEGAKE